MFKILKPQQKQNGRVLSARMQRRNSKKVVSPLTKTLPRGSRIRAVISQLLQAVPPNRRDYRLLARTSFKWQNQF